MFPKLTAKNLIVSVRKYFVFRRTCFGFSVAILMKSSNFFVHCIEILYLFRRNYANSSSKFKKCYDLRFKSYTHNLLVNTAPLL